VGGNIALNGGAGGNGTTTNGNGGSVIIISGAPGTGAGTAGTSGSVYLRSNAGGTPGSVFLQSSAQTARIQVNDTGLGFFAAAPIAKPAVTGSLSLVTDANAKAVLTSLLTALANLGLLTNSTS
jgi:hypothetical protein